MTFLLILTSFLLAVSGALKIRSTTRVGLGVTLGPVIELAVALALGLLSLGVGAGSPLVRWAVPAAVLVLIGSSARHAVRLSAHRRQREESEGGRLASYLRYRESIDRGSDDETGEAEIT